MDCYTPYLVGNQRMPCGKCAACLSRRSEEWITRLKIENEYSTSAYFVTLTYDDEHLPKDDNGNPCFNSDHLKDFHKRMRVALERKHFVTRYPLFGKKSFPLEGRPFKYFISSEYSPDSNDTGIYRPHYHGIYFDLPEDPFIADLFVRACWKYGSILTIEPLTEGRLRYTAEYALNARLASFAPDDWMPPIMRVSRGMGASLLKQDNIIDWMRSAPAKRCYMPAPGGKRLRLSRYLKLKIFDDDMRAQINDERALHYQKLSREEFEKHLDLGFELSRQLERKIRQKKLHYE